MAQSRTDTLLAALFVAIVLLSGMLAWSFWQGAGYREQALLAEARIAELARQVEALHAELTIVRTQRQVLFSDAVQATRPPVETAGTLAEHVPQQAVDSTRPMLPDSVSITEDVRLEDMPDPLHESSGITDGRRAMAALDYAQAIERFTGVEEAAPDYLDARMGVANAWFYSRQYDKAIAEFAAVLRQEPAAVEAAVGLANSYQRLGRLPEQLAAWDRVIGLEPEAWLHYNSRATAYLLQGDHERAEADFRTAARLAAPKAGDQAIALENIGLIYLWEAQWERAFEHAATVNQLDPGHGWNWLIRGIAAARLERNVYAYAAFDRWFRFKRSTDPYLLKQLLPGTLHAFIDVTPGGLARLVDPPLPSGESCVNDSQCLSYACRPGPPDNKNNYCVAADRACAAPGSIGHLLDEIIESGGTSVRCYQPLAGNARWTPDRGSIARDAGQ